MHLTFDSFSFVYT